VPAVPPPADSPVRVVRCATVGMPASQRIT
jgi:hypothetical protein